MITFSKGDLKVKNSLKSLASQRTLTPSGVPADISSSSLKNYIPQVIFVNCKIKFVRKLVITMQSKTKPQNDKQGKPASFQLANSPTKTKEKTSFKVLKQLKQSPFPVYLCKFLPDKQQAILKVFPYDKSQVSIFYKRETRLSFLKHPNIITILEMCPKSEVFEGKKCLPYSYVITQTASIGTFSHLIARGVFEGDEVLIRTYFHQLVIALEHIHLRGLAHMDLKTDNILLSEDFLLKLANFDSSVSKDDTFIHGRGTKNFRAPEVKNRMCKDPQAADIYSAGIILFALAVHKFPYLEDMTLEDYNLWAKLKLGANAFWESFELLNKQPLNLSDDFKELFIAMTAFEPEKRISIKGIKECKWYQGRTYNKVELRILMVHKLKRAEHRNKLVLTQN